MFDVTTYRRQESLAKADLPNWRMAQRHTLDIFEKTGFPVRIDALPQTRQLLDTMQEGRFAMFQEELGGLGPEELDLLLLACAQAIRFQRLNYHGRDPVLPLDTLLSALALYLKLRGLAPGFGSVLEVGPGCGYQAFFLARHSGLAAYVHTESCESFYLLQHYVSQAAFGEGFRQMAAPAQTSRFHVAPADPLSRPGLTVAPGPEPLCRQYPWWLLGALAEGPERFDVVTANANLLEMTPEALADTLALFRKKLAPGGLFFMHCTGMGTGLRNHAYLFDALSGAGFAPLCFLPGGTQIKAAEGLQPADIGDGGLVLAPGDARRFVLTNGVFVAPGHRLHEALYRPEHFREGFLANDSCLNALFAKTAGARLYSKGEIAALTGAPKAGPGAEARP